MANFAYLPNELKSAIVTYVPDARDRRSLSRTCTSIRAVAYPLSFQDIVVRVESNPEHHEFTPIVTLLRLVKRDPSLVKNVRHVRLVSQSLENDSISESFPGALRLNEKEDRELFKNLIVEFALPDQVDWIRAVYHRDEEMALVALFLCQCTNLESLRFRTGTWSEDDRVPMVLSYCSADGERPDRLSRFRKLQTVHMTCTSDEFPRSELSVLLRLPALTALTLENLPPHAQNYRHAMNLHLNSRVQIYSSRKSHGMTKLILKDCQANADTVALMLGETPQLKCLEYDCHFKNDGGILFLNSLHIGLDKVRQTLKSLTIRYRVDVEDDAEFEYHAAMCAGYVGSFQGFDRLTSLNIPLGLILASLPGSLNDDDLAFAQFVGVLPPKLEHLTINDDIWETHEVRPHLKWRLLNILGLYLTGQIEISHWDDPDRASKIWKTVAEPGWASVTPLLRGLTLDLRDRAHLFDWIWGWTLEENDSLSLLLRATHEQGIACEVLAKPPPRRPSGIQAPTEDELEAFIVERKPMWRPYQVQDRIGRLLVRRDIMREC